MNGDYLFKASIFKCLGEAFGISMHAIKGWMPVEKVRGSCAVMDEVSTG